ncbi:SAM-dependent methyltransferase [Terricaulis sp.]|uniref:SAM-dependent methyltransferase n=1 Tax=Terricaulis sp. TaxID=2768686 RepID=UPI003784210A
MSVGSLLVVGTGISLAGQCSAEARRAIVTADTVLSVMGDTLMQQWLESLNPRTRSLEGLYGTAESRPAAYAAMVEEILHEVRLGRNVCAVFYGHPGVFVRPSHEAVARARAEGFDARMLPAISAEDCLFADCGLDPAALGCQSYEARDFFFNARRFDPSAVLILWQIAVFSDDTFTKLAPDMGALSALADLLMQHYPPEHKVAVYEAATLPTEQARIAWTRLDALGSVEVSQASTLLVPAYGAPIRAPGRTALLGMHQRG